MRLYLGSQAASAATITRSAGILCAVFCVSIRAQLKLSRFTKVGDDINGGAFPGNEAAKHNRMLRSGLLPESSRHERENVVSSVNETVPLVEDRARRKSVPSLKRRQENQMKASMVDQMPIPPNHRRMASKGKHMSGHSHYMNKQSVYFDRFPTVNNIFRPGKKKRGMTLGKGSNKWKSKKGSSKKGKSNKWKSKVSKKKKVFQKVRKVSKKKKHIKKKISSNGTKSNVDLKGSGNEKEKSSINGTLNQEGINNASSIDDILDKRSFERMHFPARSLEFLRDGIDESMFTWINKDEVKARDVTCGFLTPPLGSLPDEPYPTIKVYFCMRFAEEQPAAKGYLVTHCGGPGSLSDCNIYDDVGENNLRDYNIVTFDQRGLVRSWPSFAHEECTYGMIDKNLEDGSTIRFQNPDETNAFYVDPTNEESIRDFLSRQKRRVASCWTCNSCDFQLEATDKSKTYHFLDYSGNQQAIEDIDRFRKAIRADYISLWGVSYGTAIASLYATAFPSTVDKLILDSNTTPLPDSLTYGLAKAKNVNSRMAYLIYSCSAANFVESGTCPVEDLGQCINQISDLYTENVLNFSEETQRKISSFDDLFYYLEKIVHKEEDWNALEEICDAAKDDNITALEEVLYIITGDADTKVVRASSFQDAESQPTSEDDVLGIPNYAAIMGGGSKTQNYRNHATVPQTLILGQSLSGGAYDDEYFIYKSKKVDEEYPGYGTHRPAQSFMYWFGHNFFWPKTQPTSPVGSPLLYGIVAGILFDYTTPYSVTQEMKQAFPSTVLITSQWVTHAIISVEVNEGDESCIVHFQKYLETGIVPVPNGFVCGSPLPGPKEFCGICEDDRTIV